MLTVAIILLGVIPLVVFFLLVRSARLAAEPEPDENPPEEPAQVTTTT